ncbi:MAG: hypothetical protein AAF513_09040, partial [Pseudomonadota bacterium]
MIAAAHRQTKYVAAPQLEDPVALPLPPLTDDIATAQAHLTEYGMCLFKDALTQEQVVTLRDKLTAQAEAERQLGELAPNGAHTDKQLVANLVNKGREFLDLIEGDLADVLAGYMLGKNFLVSSMTGGIFHGPVAEP